MGSWQWLLLTGIIGREVSSHSTLGKSSKTNLGRWKRDQERRDDLDKAKHL